MGMDSDEWLSRKEAARFLTRLGVPMSHYGLARLALHHNSGGGPPFTRSRVINVRYRADDLRVWADAQKQTVE